MDKIGVAMVTEKGVLFRRLYYSSLFAIKNQWFENAWTSNSWKIIIFFNQNNLETIYFYDLNEDNLICFKLIRPQSVSGQKLQKYFDSIQRLKVQKKCKSRNRRRVRKAKDLFKNEQ